MIRIRLTHPTGSAADSRQPGTQYYPEEIRVQRRRLKHDFIYLIREPRKQEPNQLIFIVNNHEVILFLCVLIDKN